MGLQGTQHDDSIRATREWYGARAGGVNGETLRLPFQSRSCPWVWERGCRPAPPAVSVAPDWQPIEFGAAEGLTVADDVLVFVSDAHFGSGPREPERRRTFLRFLESNHGVDRLLVVGDLFQFWFDLGRTLPQGFFDILDGLYRLRRSGTRIDYLAGNHDYWRGDFFRRELDVTTHAGPLELAVQGRRVLVTHGDATGPGDSGYKFLRAVVRAPVTIEIARLVHPDALQALARAAGSLSRGHTDQRPPDLARLETAARAAHARGFDAVVMGHVHVQLHRRLESGELVVIGDWLELRSSVRLESGRFTGVRDSDPPEVSAG